MVIRALFFCALLAMPALAADDPAVERPNLPDHRDSLEATINELGSGAEQRRDMARQLIKGLQGEGSVSPELLQRLGKQVAQDQPAAEPSQLHEAAEAGGEAMSLMDARTNFQTVVETHLAVGTTSGYWPWQDPKSGKAWPLAYQKVDAGTIQELGSNRFSGCVLFQRKDQAALVDLDFTVDFSGDLWKVAKVKSHSVVALPAAPNP